MRKKNHDNLKKKIVNEKKKTPKIIFQQIKRGRIK